MRLIKILYFLLPFMGTSQTHLANNTMDKLFVCYGKIKPELVKGYELVILESEHYTASEIAIFNQNNKKVVAYISLSEVNENASFYKDIKPYTIGKNKIWNSHYINLKDKKAQKVLVELIYKIKKKGIQGLFLDNLDNVSKWGKLYNQKEDLVHFLKALKKENESLYLVQNAGLFMVKELQNITDAVVVESVISSYNFNTNTYELRDAVTKKQRINDIKLAQQKVNVPFYVIEYAETFKMKKVIEGALKKMKLSAFVGQINLQFIPKFK